MQNSVNITGRMTRDPEIKQIPSGDSVLRFSLACSRDYKDKTTGDYPVDFIDCEVWRQPADYLARYGMKGCTVQVTGRLQLDDWTDNEGNKRRNAKVLCSSVYVISNKRNDESNNHGNTQGYTAQGGVEQSQGGNYGGNQTNGYSNGSEGQGGYGAGYGAGYGGGYTKGQDRQYAQQQTDIPDCLTEDEEQNLPF